MIPSPPVLSDLSLKSHQTPPFPLLCSFRLNIWTRTAPSDPTVESSLKKRIETIGKHFKTTVLSVPTDQKILPTGGNYSTELEFASHKDSEKKGNTKKIVI